MMIYARYSYVGLLRRCNILLLFYVLLCLLLTIRVNPNTYLFTYLRTTYLLIVLVYKEARSKEVSGRYWPLPLQDIVNILLQ